MATSNVTLWQAAIDALNQVIVDFGQAAVLQTRSIANPQLDSVDYGETFTKFADITIAFDTNNKGKTIFDSTGVEQSETHEGYFEFIENVTTELFLLYDNRRFEIITVEDIGELNGIIKVVLNELGSADKEASKT